jgi:hypothetical protein
MDTNQKFNNLFIIMRERDIFIFKKSILKVFFRNNIFQFLNFLHNNYKKSLFLIFKKYTKLTL